MNAIVEATQTVSAELRATLLLVAAYLAVAIVMRWAGAARPQRDHYMAEREQALAHLHALWRPPSADAAGGDSGRALRFQAASDLLEEAKTLLGHRLRLPNLLFWSGGEEHAALHYIRKAERLLVDTYPRDEVIARLHSVQEGLRDWGPETRTRAEYLAQLLRPEHAPREGRERGERVPQGLASYSTERLRAELEQAMQVWDDDELERFRRRADQQNRAMWLTGVGLLLIVGLAAVEGHAVLFLMGAAGGFLGRLMRVAGPESGKTDFGRASALLMLSPVSGAVAGWAGVLLVSAVGLAELRVSWRPLVPGALALALLFGFSELLFDRLVEGLESRVNTSRPPVTGKPAPAAPAPTA